MLSWRLFDALNVFNNHPITRHPVFRRERRHLRAQAGAPGCLNVPSGLLQAVLVAAIVGGMLASSLFLSQTPVCLIPLCWFAPLLLALPGLPLWVPPLSMTLAPALTLNRLRGRWTLLCITPQDPDTLLLALARAALNRMRSALVWLLVALFLVSLLISTALVEALLRYNARHEFVSDEQHRAILAAILWALSALLVYADRLQQVVLMAIGALLGGTLARRSVRTAVLYGMVGAGALWLVEFALGAGVVVLLPGSTESKVLAVGICLFAGAIPGYLVALPLAWALLAMVLTFALRELLLRLLWRWLGRAAWDMT